MREFVAKEKKIKVTVGGKSYEMSSPKVSDVQEINQKIKGNETNSLDVYAEFFDKLGLPKEVCLSMDAEDFISFCEFVLAPKKT